MLGFPPYLRLSQREAILYARHIIAAAQKPVQLYNNPARTGFDLSVESTVSLAADPLVISLKEAGDYQAAGKYNDAIMAALAPIYRADSLLPVLKMLLNEKGIPAGICRRPLVLPDPA